MIQGILIGLGAGFAAYSVLSLFARRFVFSGETRSIETKGTDERQKAVLSDIGVDSGEETLATEPYHALVEVSHAEIPVAAGLGSAKALEAAADEVPIVDPQLFEEAQTGKQWFLVRSNKGYLRVTFLRAKTPKAVAGPFPTKKAALQAKGLYSSRDRGVIGSATH